jgi:uncharacterized surface protein with fasciclin (FAS1) repeats
MSTNERTTVSSGTGVDESLLTATIMATAEKMPEISEFIVAVREAGLATELETPDFKTLFAPLNDALRGIRPDKLRKMVSRHVVTGKQTEADLRTVSELHSLAGPVPVAYASEGTRVGGAKIVRHDIPCMNGQIHLLDGLVDT